MASVRNISEIKEKNVFLISKIPLGKGGYSPIKVMGVPIGKFREHLSKVPESCFMGVCKFIPPLGGTNSTTTNKRYQSTNLNP